MKAIILGAGLGTRLRPLTSRWPKPAIPLLGQPLLRYTLAALKAGGISAVGINTHHLPEVMASVAKAECARLGLPLTLSREPVIQGTGGGIRGLRAFVGEQTFVVWNGDILFALDLAAVVARHQRSAALATMVLLPMPQGEKYAAVETDREDRVVRIAGQGTATGPIRRWHFTGVHVMNREVFEFMSPGGEEDINRTVYPKAIAAGRTVRGDVVQAYWSDLGTPSRYLAAQQDLLFQRVPMTVFAGSSPFDGAQRRGNSWFRGGSGQDRIAGPALLEGAQVDPSAQIGSGVYLGPGVTVGAGARLNRAAVLEGTRIGPDEEVVDAIAWERERIPAR